MNNQAIQTLELTTSVATDQIAHLVDFYADQMKTHPLANLLSNAEVPTKLLVEFAGIQYVDSVLWVPMLALMKDRVQNPRLRRALTDNILCEAGAKATSHITLCKDFLKSIGVTPFSGEYERYSKLANHPVEMMNAVIGMNEPEIAGWVLVAEAIVPSLFQMALPAFRKISGVDLTYLNEHIVVDSDEHARWMLEATYELVSEGKDTSQILSGVHLGGRTALSIPDALYAKYLRGDYD